MLNTDPIFNTDNISNENTSFNIQSRVISNEGYAYNYDSLQSNKETLPGSSDEYVKDDNELNEKLRISIIGLGYVGSVSCACFSSLGHRVIGVDADHEKVNSINQGISPIVEPNLGSLLKEGHQNKRLTATNDINQAILDSDITLISVGTPSNKDGSCNLDYLKNATKQIAQTLSTKNTYHLVVFRSTIPPTTTKNVLIPILEEYSNKIIGKDIGICFNPEFLRESTAIDDFYHPPKTVIGAIDDRSAEYGKKLYNSIDKNIIITSIEAAEFVKYIDNTWHALKVSFGNEVGRICKAMAVDSHQVMDIFLRDKKLNISPYYLKPGFAFGGSCLPKDTRGIVHMAQQNHVNIPIIEHINQSNADHIEHTINLISQLNVVRIGVIGLTFKSDTDDLRESPSLALLKRLLISGYDIQFYDPIINSERILDQDPLINQLLNDARCNDVLELVDNNQAIVITHKKKYTEQIARMSPKDKHIIDVVHLENNLPESDHYHGLCW